MSINQAHLAQARKRADAWDKQHPFGIGSMPSNGKTYTEPLKVAMVRVGTLHRPVKTRQDRFRPIADMDTGERWPSIKDAAAVIGCTPTAINQALRNEGRCRGRRLRYATTYTERTSSSHSGSSTR